MPYSVAIAGYVPHSKTWEDKADVLRKWIETHDGRMPKKNKQDRDEARQASFLQNCQQLLKHGELLPAQKTFLLAIPGMTARMGKWATESKEPSAAFIAAAEAKQKRRNRAHKAQQRMIDAVQRSRTRGLTGEQLKEQKKKDEKSGLEMQRILMEHALKKLERFEQLPLSPKTKRKNDELTRECTAQLREVKDSLERLGSALQAGDMVEAHSLEAVALNGSAGLVQKSHEGRVHVDFGEGLGVKALKPENLKLRVKRPRLQ